MPKWMDLDNAQIVKKLEQPFPRGFRRLSDEDKPLTPSEQDLGLRIFKRDGKIHAEDRESGTTSSGKSRVGDALDDLRNKMKK